MGGRHISVFYNPSNGYVYAGNGFYIGLINCSTRIADIGWLSCPLGMAYNPVNGYVYVTNYCSNMLSVIDNTTLIGSIVEIELNLTFF
ncbi:hypothetical protein [Sulfuracidifex tepidarius]|nr:hypothetical protein [Sulfuracidifex tepidarius]